MLTIVLPFNAKSFKVEMTLQAVALSKPVVGSSKKIRLGLVNNSTPIEVLFLSPPETPRIKLFPITVSAHFYNPNSVRVASTLLRILL